MQLDLNLLAVLDALLEEGSVTGAAERLRLSAPATSRSLGRIRRLTGDQILVRTGRTMTPTPYALEIRDAVHYLVEQSRAILEPKRTLDLGTLQRAFTIRGNDALTTAIAPRLLSATRQAGPDLSVRMLAETDIDTNDLRHGRVDLEISSTMPVLPEINHETLGDDRLVVAFHPDHPYAGTPLTAERFAAADHVIVSRRGRTEDPIDLALENLCLRRRVVASAPTSTAALHIVSQSELLVVVPEQICRPTLDACGLRTSTPPFGLAPVPVILAWHQRYDNDKAHAWLRAQVRDSFAAFLGHRSTTGTDADTARRPTSE
ncbi:LysR family transcriptional regulator [Streptomyces europaeiscabiei]|nr:LysR family transcriptional regulator [Streptomyces europaeiscabiei]MDX3636125.1 LysR family transcriptional regulator [Streptomyces europaeiscabiei]MDX3654297.1 LysR family transcriptional regulator [Streptomyces europaeiscabiei]